MLSVYRQPGAVATSPRGISGYAGNQVIQPMTTGSVNLKPMKVRNMGVNPAISLTASGGRSANTKSLAFTRGKLDLSTMSGSSENGRCRTILLHFAASDVPEFESRTRSLFAAVFCMEPGHVSQNPVEPGRESSDDTPPVVEASDRLPPNRERVEDVLSECVNPGWRNAKENNRDTSMSIVDQPQPLPQTSAITVESEGPAPVAPTESAQTDNSEQAEGRQPVQGRTSGRINLLRKMFSAPLNRPARSPRPPRQLSRRSVQSGPNEGSDMVSTSARLRPFPHIRTSSRGRPFTLPRRASKSSDTLKNLLTVRTGEELTATQLRSEPDGLRQQLPRSKHVTKLPWRHLGTTEIARKLGRDVEFSSTFALTFDVDHGSPILRVVLFDAGNGPGQQQLIAFSDVSVRKVFANAGVPVATRMYVPPASLLVGGVTIEDVAAFPKNRGRYNGEILVACDMVGSKIDRFRLDVECNQILRAKALTTANVKRAFYTIHCVLEKGGEEAKKGSLKDHWVLLYRSDTCEMIHGKRYGGSRNYNHFSSTRMQAGPGVIQNGQKIEGKKKERSEVTKPPTSALDHLWKKLGTNSPELFFSLPGADLFMTRKNRRLKLSMFEDHGSGKGYELIAEAQFSITHLQSMKIGDSIAIKSHTNVVGRAEMKFVDCDESDRRYFCLSLVMQSI